MQGRRVVITGMGTVNPLAHNVKDTWDALLDGKSGVSKITGFDASTYSSQIAGEVKNFDYTKYIIKEENLKTARRMDKFVHYSAAAVKEAIEHSGLDIASDPTKVGICLGSGIGGISTNEVNITKMVKSGHRRVSPFYIPAFIGNIAAGFLSIEYGILGPNYSVQSACASGNHALATAMMLIQSGHADAMVSGGCEAAITESAVAGFANMKALSTKYNDAPETASRPYDLGRDGFVIGEGAASLILEEYEYAKRRGANIICEVLSVGMSGDAYDLVVPHPDGIGALQAMRTAVERAEINIDEIGYINSHGTATPLGDIAESTAILKLLNNRQENATVASTKSMTGHMLGATAAFEAIVAVNSLIEGKIPPNINIFEKDPKVPLDCINTEVVEKDFNVALSNSFGFGGHNSCLCIAKIE